MTLLTKFHPELRIDNFSRFDGTIMFFAFAKAAMKRCEARRVMDFGAGRGQVFEDAPDESLFKRQLMDLRSDGAEVWAVDVDPVVLMHPASNHQVRINIGEALPFEDNFFDTIVSDVVFEHVDNAEETAAELRRVLKPGGYICARTPNKWGYVSIATRLVPNRYHVSALRKVSPVKQSQDVFPTVFKMNTVTDIRRLFRGMDVAYYRDSAGPSYYFDNGLLYRAFLLLHRLLPYGLSTSLCLFIRKRR